MRLVTINLEAERTTSSITKRILQRQNLHDALIHETELPIKTSRTCKRHRGDIFGTKVSIVETPESFAHSLSKPYTKNIATNVKYLSAPGPHIFLVILRSNLPLKRVRDMLLRLQQCFGENICKHAVVLFTQPPDSHPLALEDTNHNVSRIHQILEEQGIHHMCFDDICHPDSPNNRAQVEQLIELINKIISDNGGRCINV